MVPQGEEGRKLAGLGLPQRWKIFAIILVVTLPALALLVVVLQRQGTGRGIVFSGPTLLKPLQRQLSGGDTGLGASSSFLAALNSTLYSVQAEVKDAKMLSRKDRELADRKWQGIEKELQQLQDGLKALQHEMQASLSSEMGPPAGAMVIVEPRDDPRLQYVLENFDVNMPLSYDLYIFHGKSRGGYARQSAAKVALHRHVVYVPLEADDLNYLTYGYSDLLKTPAAFWDKIDAENILIFQTDSVLCAASPRKIADFERLGYVGCGYDESAGVNSWWGPSAFWGVGGLSFRKKSKALECLAEMTAKSAGVYHPEDVYFSDCVQAGFGRRPESAIHLMDFCCQINFLSHCFGAHHLDLMNASHINSFLSYCPEAKPFTEPEWPM